jgi:CubicO group peptidase (beta-lactamase class C family)
MPNLEVSFLFPEKNWAKNDLLDEFDLEKLNDAVNDLFFNEICFGLTYAFEVIFLGRQIIKRFAEYKFNWGNSKEFITPETKFCSWSVAKSVLNCVVGVMVKKQLVHLDEKLDFKEWSRGDERRNITINHLLTMTDGLCFNENYEDFNTSDVINMLFGLGKDDVGAFMLDKKLVHCPGEVFNYSSGSTNLCSYYLGSKFKHSSEFLEFIKKEIFNPLGTFSFEFGLDKAGTWIASSYLYGTIDDYARIGYLYLRNGKWKNLQILPTSWVQYSTEPRNLDPTNNQYYGAGWWNLMDSFGTYYAAGYEGQLILVVPALDLVVVRLGKSEINQEREVLNFMKNFIEMFSEIHNRITHLRQQFL